MFRTEKFSALLLSLSIPILIGLTGCGYTLGPNSRPDVQTIHVAVFETDTFRRNIDHLLTEAVQQEIKIRSGYRLAGAQSADTILTGKIVDVRKTPLSETRFDDPRETELQLAAEVKWVDRRNGRILQERTFSLNPQLSQHSSQVSFAPEVGHSLATAQQEAVTKLAAEIVDLTEIAW